MATWNIPDAFRALEDALKLKVLRRQIKAGAEALDRGDFTEVDEAELDAYLQELSVGNSRDG
jgi:antitoxin ParD1/3/4